MKYQEGNIVLLTNGKTAYIVSVDENSEKYQACELEDEQKLYYISEASIHSLLT